MTTGPRTHPTPDPADVASLLRLLAEAADGRSFFTTLRRVLPRLLPATRVDLLAGDWPDGTHMTLAGVTLAAPSAEAAGSPAAFAEWLGTSGYSSVATLPLSGAGQHLGWLAMARRRGQLDPPALALAGQLAALIALRLLYDQSRDDLAARDEQTALLERRLREHEDTRLRATLAVGAAHDIGNLFASVMGHAQILQHDAPADLQRDLRAILLAASDGHFLLRRMLSSTPPVTVGSATQVVALPALIQDALSLTRPFWEPRPAIAIRTLMAPIPPVQAHAAELREVLVNLIINAVAAMPSGGALTLRCFTTDDRVVLEVIDTGRGIAREHQAAIFQPFTTTRESGRGLGLSVSRAIVEGYGGTLTVRSAPGQGATFALALPAARTPEGAHERLPAVAQARAISG
ncbi:MAG TPA: HAMP domain-containing sensor histidine kinase [Roseiflexaceae bacterium]|nr:HAMP domain-containing sensor histidine kinase [Roseiflexaceae bacterium]